MAVVMYRFETYVKEKTLKETRSGSYFLDKFRLGFWCSKFAHARHARYKLVPSPFRSYGRERRLELEGGNAKIKNFESQQRENYAEILPCHFTKSVYAGT